MSSDFVSWSGSTRRLNELADTSVRRGNRLRFRRHTLQAAPLALLIVVTSAIAPTWIHHSRSQVVRTFNPAAGKPSSSNGVQGSDGARSVPSPSPAPGYPQLGGRGSGASLGPGSNATNPSTAGAAPAPSRQAPPTTSHATAGPDQCVLIGRFAPVAGGGFNGGGLPSAGASTPPGSSQTCDYDATQPAGFTTNNGKGGWEVDVRHPNGSTTVFSPTQRYTWQGCQPVDTIAPGDHVHVSLADDISGSSSYIKVGPEFHC